MSPRTLIVGVLAAVCGVCATAGVLLWNRPKVTGNQSIVTARMGIGVGSKVESDMLQIDEWHASQLPEGAFRAAEQVVGKFCVAPIYKGQTVLAGQLDDAPTTMQPEPGYFAVAINTDTESSNLGKNLVAGNRVDVIWVMTKSHEDLGGPFSVRLLENVRVLAVGQNATPTLGTDFRRDLKSVTLEVKPKMDENLVLAQELGTLSLSMRNPNDMEDVEPSLLTNIADLLKAAKKEREAASAEPVNSAFEQMKSMVDGVLSRVDQLAQKVESIKSAPAPVRTSLDDEALRRIPAGMRAVTIQTPSESTGVAGLLLPGHRVDVVVTWDNQIFDRFNPIAKERESRSLVLLENVEVLAVDTQTEVRSEDQDKKMSRSVTLIVSLEMGRQLSQAEELGTLTLVLRGKEDSQSSEPRQVCDLDQYLSSCMAQAKVPEKTTEAGIVRSDVVPVRINRGGASQDLMFLVRKPNANNE